MSTKITYKGKNKNVPKKYIPSSLTQSDKKKQIKSIILNEKRPTVKSATTKRSTHATAFENKYGYKISDTNKIAKSIISKKGIKQILSKGRGAYYSGGSRPNQTSESWALARLASVIMNGKARKVDMEIWNKHKIK